MPTAGISEYEFHYKMTRVIRKSWDAHTQYNMPSCFSKWYYYGPFVSGVFKEGSKLVLGVALHSWAQAVWQRVHGQDLSAYPVAGSGLKFVTTINGEPWESWLAAWADDFISISRDPNSRFNEAVDPYFEGGPFMLLDLMPEGNITLGFNDSTTEVCVCVKTDADDGDADGVMVLPMA